MVHILVVEDDVKLNQIVCTYLNDSGFQAKGCLSANEAYDEMYNNLYDLIISDIMMPGIDGFEFARSVRQVNKTIPILFMSAKDDLPSKKKGFQLGIDDYMVKPFSPAEMVARVRSHIRIHEQLLGEREAKERAIQIRDLEIFPQERRVYRKQREVSLTNKEFELLQMIETIWGAGYRLRID